MPPDTGKRNNNNTYLKKKEHTFGESMHKLASVLSPHFLQHGYQKAYNLWGKGGCHFIFHIEDDA